MQNIRFNIGAGETKRFEASGRYLEIIDSEGALTIALSDAAGGVAAVGRDLLSGTFMATAYSGFTIYSATAQTVELFLTSTSGGTRRQPGNVRVIDQSADKTAAGRQFYSSALYPADAANVSFVGVLPNGARVAVRALVLQSATAGAVRLGRGTAGGTTTATNAAMENKLIGAAASAARKFYGIAATANPAAGEIAGYSQIASFYLSANQPFTVEFKEPLMLTGTAVLAINGGVVNRDVSAVFALEEV